MTQNTPPDIRSVLEKLIDRTYWTKEPVNEKLATEQDRMTFVNRATEEALQAISAVVLGCMPERYTDGDEYEKGFNQAIDECTDNLRAVLGGTKENT